jgi:ketosteroid isomerase-like protein
MTARQTVEAFIERINAQDPDGLSELMSEDHAFIDALDYKVTGREAMRKGWIGYFSMVPDYWIEPETILTRGSTVAIFGRAGGTYVHDGILKPENRWEVPAAWLAIARRGKIVEWRAYTDNEPIRKIMTREKGRCG